MAKNLDPKCKLCRRAGEKLFLKGGRCFSSKCPILKRNYPPGIHGPKGHLRLSEYGLRLKEKQKVRRKYGISEKQFVNYFKKVVKFKGDTGEKLLELLERRLDNVIYRLSLASSRAQARQLINHGHFLVNGRKVTIPSYQVKTGDTITIKKEKTKKTIFQELLDLSERKEIPSWLNFDPKNQEAKVVSLPEGKDLDLGINTNLIVEYYSR